MILVGQENPCPGGDTSCKPMPCIHLRSSKLLIQKTVICQLHPNNIHETTVFFFNFIKKVNFTPPTQIIPGVRHDESLRVVVQVQPFRCGFKGLADAAETKRLTLNRWEEHTPEL